MTVVSLIGGAAIGVVLMVAPRYMENAPSWVLGILFWGGLTIFVVCLAVAVWMAMKNRDIKITGNTAKGVDSFLHIEGEADGLEVENNESESPAFMTVPGKVRNARVSGNRHKTGPGWSSERSDEDRVEEAKDRQRPRRKYFSGWSPPDKEG